MPDKYDSVVIGAGAGGLSMALLLSLSGRKKVLLLEKAPRPGGALAGFSTNGIQFDAGFHFTGALNDGGLFDHLLRLLGVRDQVTPKFLDPDRANIFHFEDAGKTIYFPYGLDRLRSSLKLQFPGESNAVNRYFDDIDRIRKATPALDLSTAHLQPEQLQEDHVTLKEYLDELTNNRLLRETLAALVMCHGSAPSEISMADNARLCAGFYESVATLEGGGESLVNAFLAELANRDVEIKCDEELVDIRGVSNRRAERFLLKSGRELETNELIFTISPQSVASILPKQHFPPAFFHRIESFEPTPGFFTVFATLPEDVKPVNENSITSIYPVDDIDALSLPEWDSPGALAVIHSKSGGGETVVTAFEPMYWKTVERWANSTRANRPPEYHEWKKAKTDEVLSRIVSKFPSYSGKLKLETACSPLTYHDYLHHYQGAAYGIKHKIGQMNLVGQARLRNIFFAGQSAILPGVLGTMTASLLIARIILGNAEFANLVAKHSR